MLNNLKRCAVIARNYAVYRQYDYLAATAKRDFPLDTDSEFVISVASYPKRIHLVPAVFESLARQEARARHAYLVLSEEDFPKRKLPSSISQLQERGVVVIWTNNNPYAVKKLMPVWGRDPDCAVCTFDDDIIYEKTVTQRLAIGAHERPQTIIGFWGKSLYRRGEQLSMWFREPANVNGTLIGNQVYLLGGGGVWYPPESLHPNVLNIDDVHEIVPGRGSDIWFWAAAHAAGAVHAWISPKGTQRLWTPIPQNQTTQPKEQPGRDILEDRFQKAVDYFGIRDKLIKELPNRLADSPDISTRLLQG